MEKPINGKKKKLSQLIPHTHTAKDFPHRTRRGALISFLNFGANAIDDNFSRGKEKQKRTVAFLYTFFLFYAMLIYISYFCLGFDGYRGH